MLRIKVGSDQEKWWTGVQLFSTSTIRFYLSIVLQHRQLCHCSTIASGFAKINWTDLTFSNSSLKQLYVNVSESCQTAWDKRSMRWTEGKKIWMIKERDGSFINSWAPEMCCVHFKKSLLHPPLCFFSVSQIKNRMCVCVCVCPRRRACVCVRVWQHQNFNRIT